MKQVNIYSGYKQLCYIKNLKLNNGKLVLIETGFEIINKPEEFFYNRLGVLMDITGNIALTPEDASDYLKYMVEQNPNSKDIKCSCVNPDRLTYSRTISKKDLKTLRKSQQKIKLHD